jgi:hypothetical protein
MNAFKALMLVPLAASQIAFAAEQVEASLNGQDDNEPQVVAFYNQQCNRMADENSLQGDDRTAAIKACLEDAPNVWPVGQEKDEG